METVVLNLESKEKLDNNSIEKLLKKYLTAVDSIAVKQVSNICADNGITYIAKIVADCDSKVLLSQVYSISKVLDQDCIAYSSSDSVIGKGFIGIKPYDKFDDELFIDYDSKVLLSQLYSVSRILDQDCIAYSSSDSVIGQGFIGIKPYDKFDDELFIDYDSIKPLATVKGVER